MEYYWVWCKESKGIGKVKWQRRGRHGVRHGIRHGGAVQRRMRRLQRLIPGGRGLKADGLLLQTAEYIMQLRSQVDVLQALTNIYDPLLSKC